MDELNNFRVSPLLNAQFVITSDTIYVSACNYNGLYAVDIASGKLRFIGKFLNQGNFDTFMFGVKQYGSKLVFVPGCAQEIAFYDLDTEQIEEIPMQHVFSTNTIVVSAYLVINDILYLFPAQSSSIILYSISSKEIIDIIDIVDIYKKNFDCGYVALSATDTYYFDKNKIYIPCWMHPALMRFDLDSRKVTFYRVTGCGQGFCSLCGMGDSIYALGRNGVLVKWDIRSEKVLDRAEIVSDNNMAEIFRRIEIIGEHIYLIADSGRLKVIRTDLYMHVESEGLPKEITDGLGQECPDEIIYIGGISDEKMYCYTDKNRYFCIDMKNARMEWVRTILYNADELKRIIFDDTDLQERCQVIQETEAVGLNELMEMVCSRRKIGKKEQHRVGEKIYRAVLE